MLYTLPLAPLILILSETVLGVNGLTIRTPDDLVSFSISVNSGTDYSGTTVYLDSDIDFALSSQQFDPIGNEGNYFKGVFDGQGHIISNLALTSSSFQNVGFFGFSEGLTVKNLLFDESCFFTSSYTSTSTYGIVGSSVGNCRACTVENIINMGNIVFSGTVNYLSLGGIAGIFWPLNTVRNCANYGHIKQSGTANNNGYVGGGCWAM